jgi:predicted DNA binding protein
MKQLGDEPYHVTIEIVNEQCEGLKILKGLGIEECTLVDIRGSPDGSTKHLVRVASRELSKLPKDRFTKAHVGGFKGGSASAWFDTNGCDVCNTILASDSFLVSGRHIKEYTIVYSFVAPNFTSFNRIISTLESRGLKPKILEMGKFNPKGRALTEKQERVLWLALRMGFFEYPRKIKMSELSERLGVGLSTLSEITRRGLRRLVEEHFKT